MVVESLTAPAAKRKTPVGGRKSEPGLDTFFLFMEEPSEGSEYQTRAQ